MEENDARTSSTDEFVNYMPSMPAVSSEPGRVERFLQTLFRRRGELRPVVQDRDETVVRTDDL